MKNAARAALLFFLTAALIGGGALAATVEQTQVCMPEIDVYLYADGSDLSALTTDDISASLGEEPLAVESLDKSEQGIFYVYMLDISASIPDAHFNAAREALLSAFSRLRSQDSLALITFGNDVNLLLSGGESREEVTAALDSLQNRDNSTKFYNAMDALVELVLKTEDMRRVAVVISDGIDDTDAGMTQEELENKLRQTGVSVSALCIDTAAEDTRARFESFLSVSGGALYTFGPNNAGAVLDTLLDRLDGGWLLRLRAGTNIASGTETPLAIDLGGTKLGLEVTPKQWTPDDTPPRVSEARYDAGENTVTVTFSEPVAGGGETSAYSLADDAGNKIDILSVTEAGPAAYCLQLGGPLTDPGSVTLSVSGLRDVSMEQNEMRAYAESLVPRAAAAETGTPAPDAAPREAPVKIGIWIIIGAGILLAGIAAAVVVLTRGKLRAEKKKRPAKPKAAAGAGQGGPEATFMFLNGDERSEK